MILDSLTSLFLLTSFSNSALSFYFPFLPKNSRLKPTMKSLASAISSTSFPSSYPVSPPLITSHHERWGGTELGRGWAEKWHGNGVGEGEEWGDEVWGENVW